MNACNSIVCTLCFRYICNLHTCYSSCLEPLKDIWKYYYYIYYAIKCKVKNYLTLVSLDSYLKGLTQSRESQAKSYPAPRPTHISREKPDCFGMTPPPFTAFRLLVVTCNRPPAAHAARLDPIRARPPNDLRSAIRKLKVFGFLFRCFKSVFRILRRRLGPPGENKA
uniref:Uncharacterized protein n=1 Tax=Ananas comosus var. bracteatus TaxID=296719 RepID=A0A6V7PL48_ANACO|nr:unnamed protein product [Ananas comosus var. bracteatus]